MLDICYKKRTIIVEDSINLVFLQGICMPIFFLRQFRFDASRRGTITLDSSHFRLDASRARAVLDTNTATGEELNVTYTVTLQAAWFARPFSLLSVIFAFRNAADVAFIEQPRNVCESQL